MNQNFSLFQLLTFFDFKKSTPIGVSDYECFSNHASFDHIIYIIKSNDTLIFIDNFLNSGTKDDLISLFNFSADEADLIKGIKNETISILTETSVENFRKRLLDLHKPTLNFYSPFVKKTVFFDKNGNTKIPLFNKSGLITNTLTLIEGVPFELNINSGFSKFDILNTTALNLYTSFDFIETYETNPHFEDPFLFINKPFSPYTYFQLADIISKIDLITIIEDKSNFSNSLAAFFNILNFEVPSFNFDYYNESAHDYISISHSSTSELHNYTNLIEKNLFRNLTTLKLSTDISFDYFAFKSVLKIHTLSNLKYLFVYTLISTFKYKTQISFSNSKIITLLNSLKEKNSTSFQPDLNKKTFFMPDYLNQKEKVTEIISVDINTPITTDNNVDPDNFDSSSNYLSDSEHLETGDFF